MKRLFSRRGEATKTDAAGSAVLRGLDEVSAATVTQGTGRCVLTS
jgi:hypothetical protein